MLYHPPPDTHAIYLDQSGTGAPRVAVTYARKGRRGGGRRILSLAGAERDAAYPALSDILYEHTGRRLRTAAAGLPPGEYHAVNEYCANQMLLAMYAVKGAKDARRGGALAAAVARMHDCEAGWWYALHTNRRRPRRVLRALELIYA